MLRNYRKIQTNNWSQKALQDAQLDRTENGTLFQKLSKKCNIPSSSLERHLRAVGKVVSSTDQGRKLVFSPDETQDLKQCIVVLASPGFGMWIKDVAQPVEPYVQHDHEKGKKVLKFKRRPGYTGPDWLNSYMSKNSLSLKEATKCRHAQYNDQELIYNI